MNTRFTHKTALSLLLGGTLSVMLTPAWAVFTPLDISQIPLILGTSGMIPNVMLMIDNSGSMATDVPLVGPPVLPSDMPSGFTYTCANTVSSKGVTTVKIIAGGASTAAAATTVIRVKMSGDNSPKVYKVSTSSLVSFGSSMCFDNTQYYKVANYDDATLLGTGAFLGANLNWYFSKLAATPFTVTLTKPTTVTVATTTTPLYFVQGSLIGSLTPPYYSTRMKIAKDASINLVNKLTPKPDEQATIRIGLSTLNGTDGGQILVALDDLSDPTQDGSGVPQKKNVRSHVQAQRILDKIGTTTLSVSNNNISVSSNTGLGTTSYTPTAETLAEIGKYFTTIPITVPPTPPLPLTLHPSGTAANPIPTCTTNPLSSVKCTAPIASIFPSTINDNTGRATCADPTDPDNVDKSVACFSIPPIQASCQQSAVILVSDGLPNADRAISTYLQDYTGDCSATKSPRLCDSTATTDDAVYFPGPSTPISSTVSTNSCDSSPFYSMVCKNGSKPGRAYEQMGSDYLDDVAKALYEMDLRPDTPDFKNNIVTYTIGIADPSLKSNSILKDAAAVSNGQFVFAEDYQTLATALDDFVTTIRKGIGSFSAIAVNSGQLSSDTAVFQAIYDATDWTGDFKAFALSATGVNSVAVWNAGEKIPVWTDRKLFTYNSTNKGIGFGSVSSENAGVCGLLSTDQKTKLGYSAPVPATCAATDEAVLRLNYLRGDKSKEVVSPTHPNYTTDSRISNTSPVFRNRTRFYQADGSVRQDLWLLGDIVNADPVYVGTESYGGYSRLPTAEGGGATYTSFVNSKDYTKTGWRKMAYVGANDGMLHAFDARIPVVGTATYAADLLEAGKEVFAFIPDSVYSGFKNLSSPSYKHQYFVDGSAVASDVYMPTTGTNAEWRTVVVGSTGAGGKGVFALDVTTPATFSASNVLWEISNIDPPTGLTTTEQTAFIDNIGYSIPAPIIVKLNNSTGNSWAALVANGYGGTNNKAILYIVDIKDGSIIKQIDTGAASATKANGLSSPFAADINRDGKADVVYAGDLLGNMWKFDISSPDKANWRVAYGTGTGTGTPLPLFQTACSDATSTATCNDSRQPITNKPKVGPVSASNGQSSGVMVYFGTGQYFEKNDNSTANTKTQSFYGLWDACALIKDSGGTPTCNTIPMANIVKQSIIQEYTNITPATTTTPAYTVQVRATSNKPVSYLSPSTTQGWAMDFISPPPPDGTGKNDGERIVSASLLRGGRIVFTTLIPNPTIKSTDDPCASSSSSTGWLMELNANTGARLADPALDITGDLKVNGSDIFNLSSTAVAQDKIASGTNGTGTTTSTNIPGSGVKLESSSDGVAVVTNPGSAELKITGKSSGEVVGVTGEAEIITGTGAAERQSWREVVNN
ncbi:MAG: PilC/PilY family type IV pilus protein [Methylococcales bacterium]|nr:PilC/PilY family type IV pilus protein [Methylococcales bacterium]